MTSELNMDACLAVEKEVQKVSTKFSSANDNASKNLNDLINYINDIKQELTEGGDRSELTVAQAATLHSILKKVKDTAGKVASEHKDIHGSVSKVGKAIDKNFIADLSGVHNQHVFPPFTSHHNEGPSNRINDHSAGIQDDDVEDEGREKTKLLHNVICEHFFRQGMLDITDSLISEANLEIHESQKAPFIKINCILEALKKRDLGPALLWAQENRARLASTGSHLEFRLHRLQFTELIKQGHAKQSEALAYAKNFASFANTHAKELQSLMGSLLYLRYGIENSPYSHLLDPVHWADIQDIFTRDACSLLGLSVESPLSVSTRAGCTALPALLNIKQVMAARQCTDVWSAKDELPIEIDLGKDCRYHSIFACPILRQQTTRNNPPVRLICGHVISRDALNKLSNGNNRLKCPYCPVEQNPADARQIYF